MVCGLLIGPSLLNRLTHSSSCLKFYKSSYEILLQITFLRTNLCDLTQKFVRIFVSHGLTRCFPTKSLGFKLSKQVAYLLWVRSAGNKSRRVLSLSLIVYCMHKQ